MTNQEKKQQRVNLGIEFEDAKDEFLHLREKALSLADHLDEVTTMVRINANHKPTAADFTADSELANRLGPEHQTVLSFEEIGRLIEGLRGARKKLFNLAERKSQLSSNNGSSVNVPFD
jgi:hypothetical protein